MREDGQTSAEKHTHVQRLLIDRSVDVNALMEKP